MRWSPAGRMLGACQRDRHRPRDGPGTTRGAAPGDRGAPDGPDDTLKYEEVYLQPYETFAAAEASIGHFIGCRRAAATEAAGSRSEGRSCVGSCPSSRSLPSC